MESMKKTLVQFEVIKYIDVGDPIEKETILYTEVRYSRLRLFWNDNCYRFKRKVRNIIRSLV